MWVYQSVTYKYMLCFFRMWKYSKYLQITMIWLNGHIAQILQKTTPVTLDGVDGVRPHYIWVPLSHYQLRYVLDMLSHLFYENTSGIVVLFNYISV